MGRGAAQAVEEAGLTPGEDVKIATIDGTEAALNALVDGTLSFVAEYNPLFGEQALEAVNAALEGETLDPCIAIERTTCDSPEAAEEALPDRKYRPRQGRWRPGLPGRARLSSPGPPRYRP